MSLRRPRDATAGAVLLACLLLAGCGASTPADADEAGASAQASAGGEAVNRMSVARYLRLQQEAETDSGSALLLGGYVAGLFSGFAHLAEVAEARDGARPAFCMPPGLAPGLLDLLRFLDEALLPYREGLRDADTTLLQAVMLEALEARFPCGEADTE